MNEPNSPFDGRWQITVPVEWGRTYALPSGATADSVRYEHRGVHVLTVDLEAQGQNLRGTVDWDREGTYTRTTYDAGTSVVDRDDIVHNRPAVAAMATRSGNTLTFSPGENDWVQASSPVELTLREGRLEGELLHPYLVQSWPVSGGSTQVETRFEVPIAVQLVRSGR